MLKICLCRVPFLLAAFYVCTEKSLKDGHTHGDIKGIHNLHGIAYITANECLIKSFTNFFDTSGNINGKII